MFRHKIFITVLIIVLVLGGFVGGIFVGLARVPAIERVVGVENKVSTISEEVDFAPFWEVWNVIDERYVEHNAIDNQEKVWGAIRGLTESLGDPYSTFLPPEDAKLFEEDVSGSFGGIGIEIGIRDTLLTVIAPLKGTPAEEAGIRAGDAIVAIDGISAVDISVDEAVRSIRGEPGTEVVLTMLRGENDEVIEVPLIREAILIPTIATELRDDSVFVIQLFNFSATSPIDFRTALREFATSGTDKLILDLRGNPGGFLDAAVDIVSFFLPLGEVVVREDFGGAEDEYAHRSRGFDVFTDELKMVVLVDRGSASASEIVAGALQEYDIATLIGEQTFGKGSVQELIDVTSETSLKLTIARWLTPEGRSISDGGLMPDREVMLTLEDIQEERDPQLDAAVGFLQGE